MLLPNIPFSSRLVRPSTVVGFPGGDTQCPSVVSVVSYFADVPCLYPVPFFSNLINHVCSACLPLTQMFDFLSRYVMFNILLSIFVCAAASLFFA